MVVHVSPSDIDALAHIIHMHCHHAQESEQNIREQLADSNYSSSFTREVRDNMHIDLGLMAFLNFSGPSTSEQTNCPYWEIVQAGGSADNPTYTLNVPQDSSLGISMRWDNPDQFTITRAQLQAAGAIVHTAQHLQLNPDQLSATTHDFPDGDAYVQISNSANASESYGILVDQHGQALLPPVHLPPQFHNPRLNNPDQLGAMLHTLYNQAHRSNLSINSLSLDEIHDGSMCYLTINEASKGDHQYWNNQNFFGGYVARVNSPNDMTIFGLNQWASPYAYGNGGAVPDTGDHWSQYSKAGLVAELLSNEPSHPSDPQIVTLYINENMHGEVDQYEVDWRRWGHVDNTDLPSPITFQESQQYGRYH